MTAFSSAEFGSSRVRTAIAHADSSITREAMISSSDWKYLRPPAAWHASNPWPCEHRPPHSLAAAIIAEEEEEEEEEEGGRWHHVNFVGKP
eukprot:COSAG01_NODE_9624_length_2386_cov_2.383035_3_plen_91_part_00